MGFYERIDARDVRKTGRPVSFVPKGALTHHPEGAVVLPAITSLGNRALCEADAAPAGALWTMSQSCGLVAIVHAVGYVFCFIIKTTRRLPAKTCHWQLRRREGVAVHDTLFFLRKRNKNKATPFLRIMQSERKPRCRVSLKRKVKTNGNLSSGSKGGQPWNRTLCRGCCGLSELFSVAQ